MKKIMLLAVWQLVIIAVYSQTSSPASTVNRDYLKKSKNQKTTAWVLLGGGTTFTMVGMAIGFNEMMTDLGNIFTDEPEKSSSTGEVFFFTGLAAMAGSIPFFIAASKNKRNANTVSAHFKIEQQPSVSQGVLIRTPYPAIAVKISL